MNFCALRIQRLLVEADGERAAVRHRVARVHAEIHDDLLHLRGVGVNDAGLVGNLRVDLDAARKRLARDALHFENQMLWVHCDAFALDASCEHQHLTNNVRATPRTGFQSLETRLHAFILGVVLDELHGHHDRREDIVQIVREAAREIADAFEPLAAEQLRFKTFLFGDVRVDNENGTRFPIGLAHERPAALDHQLAAVARFLPDFTGPFAGVLHGVERARGFKRVGAGQQFRAGAGLRLGRRPAVKLVRAIVPK